MEYNIGIRDMIVGDSVEGFYIMKTAVSKVASNGRPFLSVVLSDVTGIVDGKVWDYSGPVTPEQEGQIVKIRGTVGEFRGSKQLNIDRIRLTTPQDPVELSELVPVAPIDTEDTYRNILAMVDEIQDAHYRSICRRMLELHGETLKKIPAAKSVHHSFLNGLLMHTADMMETAKHLARQHEDVVDGDLLLAGTLLHDFAKSREFVFSELGLVTDYSVKGQLLGHLVMGAQEVAQVAAELSVPEDKSMLLQHLILSHHGEPDHGAAVRPMCAEAELLSLIDLIDSRMEIYRETFKEMDPGTFSPRLFALDKRIYRHKSDD